MADKWQEFVAPYFRKRCLLEGDGGEEITFYAFDAKKEAEALDSLVEDYLGSEEFLESELKKQLGLARDEAVVFGLRSGFEGKDGQSLKKVLEDDTMSQVEGLLYYNPKTGVVFTDNEGTFSLFPNKAAAKRVDQIDIVLQSEDEAEDEDE